VHNKQGISRFFGEIPQLQRYLSSAFSMLTPEYLSRLCLKLFIVWFAVSGIAGISSEQESMLTAKNTGQGFTPVDFTG